MKPFVFDWPHWLAFAMVTLAAASYVFTHARRPASKVPGPWYSNWTSAIITYHFIRGNRTYYVHSLHEKYGPVVRISPNEVDVSEISSVKTIFNMKEDFVKSDFYKNFTASEDDIFNTPNVKYNRSLRRLLGGPMADSSLKHMEPTIVSHVALAIRKINDEMKTRGRADVLKWWSFMATDIIGQLTFGESFKTLENGKASPSLYTEDLASLVPAGALRATFPILIPISDYFPLPFFNSARKAGLRLIKYGTESLYRYQRLVDRKPESVPKTLFTNLFNAANEDRLSSRELRNTAQAYIVAGTDTTANTLTYLVWAVCREPAIKHALVDELKSLPDDYSDADLRKLKLLTHVIDETLRVYSAVSAGLPRVVPQNGTTLGGYWLPAGTIVSTQPYTMHRNPQIFADPDVFRPGRWENKCDKMKDSFMPFGRAGRVCIGQHLAYMELRHAAAAFFRRFPEARVSFAEGMTNDGMKPKIYFLMVPSGNQCLIEGR